MGGIYSTNDKSNSNIRQNNGNSLINFSSESSQINSGAYTSAFHPSPIAAVNRSNQNDLSGGLNGAFARGLNANIAANHGSFAMGQNQRPREKDLPILGNEELMNYRYMTEGNPFQAARNISMSPNSVLSSQFKHQNYSHGHAHGPGHAAHGLLMNSPLQQQQARQPGTVLSQMTVSKGDGLQTGGGTSQLHQSCSKLSADVSNRVNSSAYQLSAPHMSQPGLFQTNKRLQLLSQPPNKRPRLSHDFTNIGAAAAAAAAAHQTTNSIGQTSHFLALGGHGDNGKKLSTSPHKQQMGQQTQIHHHPTQQQHSLSHNQQQQQTQHNIALYNKGNVSSNGVWSNKEPSYYPQVEAISPVPDEMRHGDLKSITEKDDIGEKLRDLEDEIIKQQELVNRLKDKTDYLNNKINQPNIDTSIKEEDSLVPLSRDPIQLIIANNQRKATEQHQFFQKFCGEHVSWHPLALPIYKQPSDIELVMNIKNHFHKTFKPLLTKYIRRRKLAEIARLKVLAQDYEVSAKAWYKRLEKFENSAKRRQKELKYREQFEKVFPEIKRNREEKEKDSTDLGDGFSLNYENNNNNNNNGAIVTNSFANTRSVSHSCNGANVSEQMRSHTPYDSVKEIEKMREYAIDPPIILPSWNKNFGLADCSRLVKEPKHRHASFQSYKNNWSREEVEIFKEQYINTPKNFGRISTFLPKKTASDCIQYYYLTKKKANYKALVKKNARRRRVQAERQQRFRGDTDHSNLGSIQQPTSDLNIDNGSSQTDNNLKVEPLLSNNFVEIDSNHKELVIRQEQPRSLYNSEITNLQTGKYCVDSKNGAQQSSDFSDKKNSSQEQTTKTNKESNVSCSDRNSFRNSRDSDSDGNDEVHRFNPPTQCLTVASSSSQFNKNSNNESDYKSDKEKHSDKCSDSYYTNTSKQSSQTNYKLDSKSQSNPICKQEYIQIKDAIEYSIEQNLSQCSDNKREMNTFQMIDHNNYRTDQVGDKKPFKNFDNLSIFQNINMENNANESYKGTYLSQNSRENSAFQEVKKDLANKSLDKSILINSSVNRKILMKDFCTAQIINHVPINGTIHSKSSPISFQKTPSTSNFIDPFIHENSNKSINVMNKKSDFFIDRVSKLYEEEVEPYTDEFRNRSDSQRTRTSSEASQMYAYIKDRSLKNENRLRNALPLKSYSDKKAFTMTDSRLKMPPPEITDQKVFRSQKSSISKKNPYSKTTTSKDCDINENETIKNKIIIDDSMEDDFEENTEKRKVVTAANILNSITDKNSYCNEDVKLITPPNKIGDIFKTSEIFGENQKNSALKNSIMTLDGHIKQNLSEKRLSNFIYQNKNEYCKKNFTVPLKKRDKSSLSDDHNVKVLNTSPILTSNIKKVKHVTDPSDSLSKYYFEKNNNIVSKEKLDVDTDENYDSAESPRFNSPGKLLIDLGSNSDGN